MNEIKVGDRGYYGAPKYTVEVIELTPHTAWPVTVKWLYDPERGHMSIVTKNLEYLHITERSGASAGA